MADHKIILENIIRECVKALGTEVVMEIINHKPEETLKPKKVIEEKKKRIPRMSPTLADQLKKELTIVGLSYDDKKEFEKIKKEFVSYADDLTDDDFTSKSLTEHMRYFATTKAPAEEKAVVVEKVVNTEEKVVKVAAKKPKKSSQKEEIKKIEPPLDESEVRTLTLEDLRSIEMLASPSGEPNGVYWDADNGRWVKGPDADTDEDVIEVGFEKNTYVVGEKSGRVYKESETSGPDTFLGFVGVGTFRNMRMP